MGLVATLAVHALAVPDGFDPICRARLRNVTTRFKEMPALAYLRACRSAKCQKRFRELEEQGLEVPR